MIGTQKLIEVDGTNYRATSGIFRIGKGWQASGPGRTSLYFSDKKHGGTRHALKAALAWRKAAFAGTTTTPPVVAALTDVVIKGGWQPEPAVVKLPARFKLPEGITGPHLENEQAVLHVRVPGAKLGEPAETLKVVIATRDTWSVERLQAAVVEAGELRRAAVRSMSFV